MHIKDLVGQITTLTVSRQADFGYFLTNGEEDVLLHNNEAKEEYRIGEAVEVFLYIDSQNRVAASSFLPSVTLGDYNWATVTEVKNTFGVFLHIGIQKEILLGAEDLPALKTVWPKKGDLLYITLRVNKNYRIYAKLASDEIMKEKAIKADKKVLNKNINGHIYRTSKVGSWIITAEGYKGFIHQSERKREPRLGEKVSGRIIDVKEDGSINVSLLPRKQETIDDNANNILSYLKDRNGAMPYWDKSLPEDIAARFQMSKAAFKRALGKLMKEGKVYQENGWTYENKEH
ncbi:hypothetical protein H1Z61_04845 [Bacillus aquiflavi]|uniref:S1 motif domain-containing protein n=1 Tax=Bacillus aquiflavi TaxID=2672567 RepID=A0A6B3VUE8_9BACI|nr:S1-like domain-containing RNA-binding protein [Bacillus aquiflavi]MBA4536491.1 hypothetical protein [Bacillus aquiflavi]NEY80858.1 hypothetical protein [Bacillus aquiflavi]UAC49054.1 hypothetical protein K6959_03905 [Bacillus aquiflavi]